MKINWGRVINAGLIAEILLLVIFKLISQKYGMGPFSLTFVVVGAFVFMLVGAIWVGRKIESRFVLHGFLVGVIGIVFYVINSLPEMISGELPFNWAATIGGHAPKIIGGIVGGFIASKIKK